MSHQMNYKLSIISERNIYKKHHVSYDTVLGMENAFNNNDGVNIKEASVIAHKVNSVLKRIGGGGVQLVAPFDIPDTEIVLFIAMSYGNLNTRRALLKQVAKRHKLVIYCFDTWEAEYEIWEKLFKEIKPQFIFLAYESSVHYFSEKFKNVFWLPQSMDEKFFYPRNEMKKGRLFMQMGRKNQKIHKMILNYLDKNNLPDIDENYIYERVPKKIIFPDTNELAENICRTKYFVCAPQSDENSKLTGGCSDVTARFYEAMACKTLIIGFKPATFDTLFPKNSMIELKPDGTDFDEKIFYYESHPNEYKMIVDENYELVMKLHRWQNRYENLMDIVS